MIFAWILKNPLYALVAALALLVGLWWAWSALTDDPGAEARLAKNQAEAARESGSDAVETVGAAGKREADSVDLTRTNSEEIRNAQGADAAVDPAARDAGLTALCRRASYKNNPRCAASR